MQVNGIAIGDTNNLFPVNQTQTAFKAEEVAVDNIRIEALADKYLGGQVMQLSQIATVAGLPEKAARGDEIGAKLADLGLAEPTNTPAAASAFSATPAANKPAPAPKPAPAAPKAGR